MAFGRQVQDRVGLVRRENPVERGPIADIDMLEAVSRIVGDTGHIVEAGRIGQRIEVDHLVAFRDGRAHHGRANETGAAGDQDLHCSILMHHHHRQRVNQSP